MRTSTHYELNLVEGTDKVNPLVQDVPNYETIDESMYNNKCASIGIATELRTGTVHALTRQNEDAPMFRFTASSNYAVGDTFTVDGVQVSALLVDGTPLPNMTYIIGSEVLCVLKGTLMTVFANRTTSSDSDRLGGELPSHYATDSDLDALERVVDAHTGQISQINSDLVTKHPIDVTNLFSISDTNVFWSAIYNPIAKTVKLSCYGHGSYPNGSIRFTVPQEFAFNMPNQYIIGALGSVRSSNDAYAFTLAKFNTSNNIQQVEVNYSQGITAEEVSFSIEYRVVH